MSTHQRKISARFESPSFVLEGYHYFRDIDSTHYFEAVDGTEITVGISVADDQKKNQAPELVGVRTSHMAFGLWEIWRRGPQV